MPPCGFGLHNSSVVFFLLVFCPPHFSVLSCPRRPRPRPTRRVVTYTFVTQRANIDKSVGTKTTEGSVRTPVRSCGIPGYLPSHTSPVRHAASRSRYTRVHSRPIAGEEEEKGGRALSIATAVLLDFMRSGRTVKLEIFGNKRSDRSQVEVGSVVGFTEAEAGLLGVRE